MGAFNNLLNKPLWKTDYGGQTTLKDVVVAGTTSIASFLGLMSASMKPQAQIAPIDSPINQNAEYVASSDKPVEVINRLSNIDFGLRSYELRAYSKAKKKIEANGSKVLLDLVAQRQQNASEQAIASAQAIISDFGL